MEKRKAGYNSSNNNNNNKCRTEKTGNKLSGQQHHLEGTQPRCVYLPGINLVWIWPGQCKTFCPQREWIVASGLLRTTSITRCQKWQIVPKIHCFAACWTTDIYNYFFSKWSKRLKNIFLFVIIWKSFRKYISKHKKKNFSVIENKTENCYWRKCIVIRWEEILAINFETSDIFSEIFCWTKWAFWRQINSYTLQVMGTLKNTFEYLILFDTVKKHHDMFIHYPEKRIHNEFI